MGGGQGMGLCEPSTEQFWKIKLDTIHFDSIFEAFIWNNQQNGSYAHNHENSNTYFDVMELLEFWWIIKLGIYLFIHLLFLLLVTKQNFN